MQTTHPAAEPRLVTDVSKPPTWARQSGSYRALAEHGQTNQLVDGPVSEVRECGASVMTLRQPSARNEFTHSGNETRAVALVVRTSPWIRACDAAPSSSQRRQLK